MNTQWIAVARLTIESQAVPFTRAILSIEHSDDDTHRWWLDVIGAFPAHMREACAVQMTTAQGAQLGGFALIKDNSPELLSRLSRDGQVMVPYSLIGSGTLTGWT